MNVYLVEANPRHVRDIQDQWVFRRAAVVSINEEAAVQCVIKGLQGGEVFSGLQDTGQYSRPRDTGYFDPDTCLVTEIATESEAVTPERRRSRIIVWELCPPMTKTQKSEDDPNFA